MRGLLAAKTRESLTIHHLRIDVPRFPDFVYAWFEPDLDGIRSAKDIHSALVQADEDRWGLYYGVKTLAQDDPEAKIFWALLDEAQGEDGLSFVCHCLSVAMSLGGMELWSQFGDAFEHCAGATTRQLTPASVQPIIWLDLRTAREAVRKILVRALKSQLQEILDSIEGESRERVIQRIYLGALSSRYHTVYFLLRLKYTMCVSVALKEVPVFPPMLVPSTSFKAEVENATEVDGSTVAAGEEGEPKPTDVDGDASLSEAVSRAAKAVAAAAAAPPSRPGTRSSVQLTLDKDKTSQEPTHINLFVWLRLLLHRFQMEQSHRSAAVRLMFDTASVGALTPQAQVHHLPPSGSGAGSGQLHNADEGSHVEFPQFQVR